MTAAPGDLIEVRISMPDAESAQQMATDLVTRGLAACVQCLGPMTSVYSWQGSVHQAEEWLLLAKTTAAAYPLVEDAVTIAHRYKVPEVLAVPVTHSLETYADWVRERSTG